jgi:hypothetical protein
MSDENPNFIPRNPEGLYDGDLRVKQLYDITSTFIYVGRAPLGTASNAAAWLIKRVALDVGGNPTESVWTGTTAVWDNRVAEAYT